jgi:hypothetical protein
MRLDDAGLMKWPVRPSGQSYSCFRQTLFPHGSKLALWTLTSSKLLFSTVGVRPDKRAAVLPSRGLCVKLESGRLAAG